MANSTFVRGLIEEKKDKQEIDRKAISSHRESLFNELVKNKYNPEKYNLNDLRALFELLFSAIENFQDLFKEIDELKKS